MNTADHGLATEDISLAKAASLAGVSWAQMRDILVEQGIQPRLGAKPLRKPGKKFRSCDCHLANAEW